MGPQSKPFRKNCVQIGLFVRVEFSSHAEPDTQTDTHTQTNCSENTRDIVDQGSTCTGK